MNSMYLFLYSFSSFVKFSGTCDRNSLPVLKCFEMLLNLHNLLIQISCIEFEDFLPSFKVSGSQNHFCLWVCFDKFLYIKCSWNVRYSFDTSHCILRNCIIVLETQMSTHFEIWLLVATKYYVFKKWK